MKDNQCETCGKFSRYEDLDSYTPFGCSNYASPEPYDPIVICKKCSVLLYEEYILRFINEDFSGDWQKSNAEIMAAKDSGLVWIGSNSITIDGKRILYRYMRKTDYELTPPNQNS